MVIYRPHRGGLAEAMRECAEFETFDEMKRYIVEQERKYWGRAAFSEEDIVIDDVSYNDERIGWKDCRYVCVKRYFGKEYDVPQCRGMCATDYER